MDAGENDVTATDWAAFPGGELEAPRPRVRCAACRARGDGEGRLLCFACYREHLERQRAIGDVLSRVVSPFTSAAATSGPEGTGGVIRHFRVPPTPGDDDPRYVRFAHRRRQAQIAARRALAEPIIDLERFPVSWRPFIREASR